ncbi:Complex 1 LYR protein domain [Dillenia turbinata]|uniref:Complex 1 LYR protein domain n=1 Tax=Dillenia turbinata TaxID=194707 RepID=A0AAN8VPS3_9MAGN
MGGAKPLSGMQKQVLSLYRGFMRVARSKSPEDRRQIESIVSAEFRRYSKLVDQSKPLGHSDAGSYSQPQENR